MPESQQRDGLVSASSDIEADVLIIGGGPAGSTAAALLASKGRKVCLAEKDRHPRFHIGESLLPMNMPIFERLGIAADVARIGMVKRGADFPANNEEGYRVFRFSGMSRPVCDHAYQVRREEFDAMLFNNARSRGAQCLERCRIDGVQITGDEVLASATLDAAPITIRARYLIDASGRDTFLGNRWSLKRKHEKHRSAALFAHFCGVERRPGEDAGNISIYRFAHGWVWVIPLRDGITSIGAVCTPEYLKQRDGDNKSFLLATLQRIEQLAPRLRAAEVVGNLHATGNYSYLCRRWAGPRWLMVGDACAFLDPIFSTGVFLAMHGGERASGIVDRILADPRQERALQKKYCAELNRGIRAFSWFIYRFTAPATAWLFANARNLMGVEAAMISMLGGDVFDNAFAARRLYVFRALYFFRSLATLKHSIAAWRVRRRQLHAEFKQGTTAQDPI
jgi:flavin-dependent dehydrogenase